MDSSLYKFQVALRLCEDHYKKELHAYCKTCEKKICPSCIKEDHTTHDWETITDILREKKRSLPVECREIRTKQLPGLRKEIDIFERKIQIEDATLAQNKSVLNSTRRKYIDEINTLFDDRINHCQQTHDKATAIYGQNRDRLKQKVKYLDMMTTALDKDINTLPEHDILDMEKEMRDELEKALSYSADKYTFTTMFKPGKLKVQALEDMIGELHSVSVEEKYNIDRYHQGITSINPVSDTSVWITTVEAMYAKLLDRTGAELKEMNTPCSDMIIMRSGEYVLSELKKRKISLLTKDENMIRSISTKPLLPFRISKTENDDILVTLRDGGDPYHLVPTSRRVVQRMTLTGEVLHMYELRKNDKTRLFTLPIRATENKNTDVCVVNRLSVDSGELVVLHKDGRVKFTFSGNGLEADKFLPLDLECDGKCHILMTEGHSRSIHMLSSVGMYICTLCQYEQLCPFVISINAGNLWCGFVEGRVKVLKFTSV
ncbi:hypothetical protein FSP39_018002 [Pinctada imbricata]|uniref:B box-type domain-containing protein n=1 Tax=Pinctada imbricata TaxID=66713 RepID=A0AA88YPU5_PINIB|nr:hypothetical protein FSP39_018002 [Pinctada imbricata]